MICTSDPAVKKACFEMRRCIAILDLMAMNTLYGVMAFTEADLRETCRLAFDLSLGAAKKVAP